MKTAQLFLACCGQKRVPQPFGLALPGSADRCGNCSRFFGRQSNGEDNSDTFCRKPGSAHFRFHNKIHFRKRNNLTSSWTFVYKRQVSNFEAAPFQQSARTSLERLVTRDTRLQPGRAVKRLAMDAEALQVGTSDRQVRSLKIEIAGDFFHQKTKPKIRLAGNWLARAGFKPGHRVEVLLEQPGSLTLRFVEQGKEAAL